MRPLVLFTVLLFTSTAIAGCFGGDSGGDIDFDFEPGTDFEETGNTVHLKMWVEDIVQKEIWPGFFVNMWAFCAAPLDAGDEYSANAIEYWAEGEECSVPGPQLRVTQGDRVIVEFENPHFHPHTIHWHGQYVPNHSDGVQGFTQDTVMPGGKFTYDFIASRAGSLWYHCHIDTPFHIMMGLYGSMIVEPQDTTWEPKDIDREYTLILSTSIENEVAYIPPRPGEVVDPHAQHKHGTCGKASGFPDCQNPPVREHSDIFLLNGKSSPLTLQDEKTLIQLGPDERVRVRLMNMGDTFETWHVHGHDMYVTHRDGNPLHPHARFWVDTLTIGPAERYDFVLDGREGAEGVWVMHTHVEPHITNSQQAPGGMFSAIVYPGVEELRPYKAESPGGKKTQIPPQHPKDLFIDELVYLTEEGATTKWEMPVVDTCLGKFFRFTAEWRAPAAGSPLDNPLVLTSTLKGYAEDGSAADIVSTHTFTKADAVFDITVPTRNLTNEPSVFELSGTLTGRLRVHGEVLYWPNIDAARDNGNKSECDPLRFE